MSSCAGPYTRVYFNEKESKKLQALADALAARGLQAKRLNVPRGRGGVDDLSCDMAFADGTGRLWQFRPAKYLGPKKSLLGQTHVYEIPFDGDDDVAGSLFAPKLATVIDSFLNNLDAVLAGQSVDGMVPRAEAHETRIELCNDL